MIIGIAGGIGSGKTLAADYLNNQYHFEILDNDVTAREVVAKGSPTLNLIAKHFGTDILTSNGELNRTTLRQRIFDNTREKSWLESVTHPEIRNRTLNKLKSIKAGEVLLLVSPLLFESGQHELCDATLVICTSKSQQLERVQNRDGTPANTIKKIMNQQFTNDQRIALATHVLYNDDSIELLYKQLDKLALKWQ